MFHLAVVFMPVLLLGLGVAIIATLLAGLGLLIAAMVGGTSVALLVKDRSLKRLMLLGCGVQGGRPEYYRGVPVETNLLPKVQVDIVVCKIPVRTVIDTAKKVLYSGHIGDGKIFVYDVENVIKVRTGEEGYDALQDVE